MWPSFLIASAAVFFQADDPPPALPIEAPDDFACMTSPTDEETAQYYQAWVDNFSPDIIRTGMDPAFRDFVHAEARRCAGEHGWTDQQLAMAMIYTVGSLILAGSWDQLALEGEQRTAMRVAFEELSVQDIQLLLSYMQQRDSSPESRNAGVMMLAQLLGDTGVEVDEEIGPFIGGVLAGLSVSVVAVNGFNEI